MIFSKQIPGNLKSTDPRKTPSCGLKAKKKK